MLQLIDAHDSDMAITRHEPPQESDVRNNSMNSTFSKPESGSTTPPRTDARAVDDINFFMPKKKVLRPDGASLKDVYDSKKADMWGQIIKAQYKEDVCSDPPISMMYPLTYDGYSWSRRWRTAN